MTFVYLINKKHCNNNERSIGLLMAIIGPYRNNTAEYTKMVDMYKYFLPAPSCAR